MIQGSHPLGVVDRQLLEETVLGVEYHSVDTRIHLLVVTQLFLHLHPLTLHWPCGTVHHTR